MGNYRNEVENTKDYLEGISQMVVNLMDADNKPLRADLMTHLRMVYGHVDWDSLIVKLDKDTIRQIMKNKDNISVGWNTLVRNCSRRLSVSVSVKGRYGSTFPKTKLKIIYML